jgi:UDP-glucose 4-epimerase
VRVLVSGASGYIGSHVVHFLSEAGFEVFGLDLKLKTKRNIANVEIIQSDIRDSEKVTSILSSRRFDAVINLAALKSVSESISKPDLYNSVNFLGAKDLIDASIKNNVPVFLQSSTAAIYSSNESGLVSEKDTPNPSTPYGRSKLLAEDYLNNQIFSERINGASLRYFNVGGSATPDLRDDSTENLIPRVLSRISKGLPPEIYGSQYLTRDGTCERDYVHVSDVAKGHVQALETLFNKKINPAINLGSGAGYSVKEVISEILLQSHSNLVPEILEPRDGDAPKLIANIDLAKEQIGYVPTKTLEEIISSSINNSSY